MELNITFTSVLPFSISEYKKDFTKKSIIEFNTLLVKSKKVIELDYDSNQPRVIGYVNLANYIVNNCDYLIAYWDGVYTNKVGGTSDVVILFNWLEKSTNKNLFIIPVTRS